jgi:hypothetical protein
MLQIYAPSITDPRCMTAEDRCIWQSVRSARYADYEWEMTSNDTWAAEVPLLRTQHATVAEAVKATIEALDGHPDLALQNWRIY